MYRIKARFQGLIRFLIFRIVTPRIGTYNTAPVGGYTGWLTHPLAKPFSINGTLAFIRDDETLQFVW